MRCRTATIDTARTSPEEHSRRLCLRHARTALRVRRLLCSSLMSSLCAPTQPNYIEPPTSQAPTTAAVLSHPRLGRFSSHRPGNRFLGVAGGEKVAVRSRECLARIADTRRTMSHRARQLRKVRVCKKFPTGAYCFTRSLIYWFTAEANCVRRMMHHQERTPVRPSLNK